MKQIIRLSFIYCVFVFFIIILTEVYIGDLPLSSKQYKFKPLKLLITVKTTFKSHATRVRQIYDTWYQLASESIYFVSDHFDPVLNSTLQGKFINTSCGSSHDPISLGCKLGEELKLMVKMNATWSCHVDDDNYVNIPALMNILNEFNHELPYYIGRTATKRPIFQNGRSFWFAIGGAGICFSKAAIKLMAPTILKNDLYNLYAKRDKMPDDWALGFIMGLSKLFTAEIHPFLDILGIKMTEVTSFLSQYDNINLLPLHAIKDTPVLSYRESDNIFVNLPHFFHPEDDPYKFQTLHCFLFPKQCNQKLRRLRIDVYSHPKIKAISYGTYILPTIKH